MWNYSFFQLHRIWKWQWCCV